MYSNTYIPNLKEWYWRIYLQGSSGEIDIENRLTDMGRGEERVRCMERVTWKFIFTRKFTCKLDSQQEFAVWLRKVKWTLYQPRGAGWGRRWEGRLKGRGYMYTCGWFMLRFDRKQQNSVKQLSFNKKIKLQNFFP